MPALLELLFASWDFFSILIVFIINGFSYMFKVDFEHDTTWKAIIMEAIRTIDALT